MFPLKQRMESLLRWLVHLVAENKRCFGRSQGFNRFKAAAFGWSGATCCDRTRNRAQAICIFFDEPRSNLDAALRVQMRSEIRSLYKRIDVTSIYVTHDPVEALTMADTIEVLQGGKVQKVGIHLSSITSHVMFLLQLSFVLGQ